MRKKENECSCLHDIGGGGYMDYKKEIIEMIEKINDDSLLEFFYRFIARVLKNRGN